MPNLGVTEIAEIAHEMIGLYREAVDPDFSFTSWCDIDDMSQGIMRDLVKWIIENPDTTPENVHKQYRRIVSDVRELDNDMTRQMWEDLDAKTQRRFFLLRAIAVSFKRYQG